MANVGHFDAAVGKESEESGELKSAIPVGFITNVG